MSSNIEIIPVKTNREKKLFLNFPWTHYKGDPNWVPPLRQNQKELVNYAKHPFYDDAEVQTFLAFKDGVVSGRIAAIVDHGHNRKYSEERGFFGFFESVDDQEVATGLLDAVKNWHGDAGRKLLRGPVNPSMNYECALLIDGFDSQPSFMMTYNKPYYQKLIEDYGYTKSQDLFAFWGHIEMLRNIDKKIPFIAEESIRRLKITMRPMSRKNFKADIMSFLSIYNRAVDGQWGFVPLSESEVNHLANSMRFLIAPELTTFAEVDGKPIGVMFGMLNYNPRIKEIDGKLFPFGFLKLLFNRRKIKAMRLISTNVVPEYQKWGVGLVLLYRLVPDINEWGMEEAEFSWVLESNKLSRGTLERSGTKLAKTYRIFDLDVT